MKSDKKFIFLKHTADVKFQAFGNSLEKVFENSATAMFKAMSDGKIKKNIKKKIKISGKNLESLLYNFLEELLFLLDSEDFFPAKIEKINIDEKKFKLESEISGMNIRKENIEIHLDIKAVTYNEMFVKFDGKKKKWTSQVVVDV